MTTRTVPEAIAEGLITAEEVVKAEVVDLTDPQAVSVVIDVDAKGHGSLILDGHDLSNTIQGFDLRAGVGTPTYLTLRGFVRRGASLTGEAEVEIGEDLAAVLVALGWSPPDPQRADQAARGESAAPPPSGG